MDTLDLHGVKHRDVGRELDYFLYENVNKNKKEVYVITGNSQQMKNIVKEHLVDYDMTCEEDFLNSGKLIIKLI